MAPYLDHTGDRTRNDADMLYDAGNVAAVKQTGDTWAATLTIGLAS